MYSHEQLTKREYQMTRAHTKEQTDGGGGGGKRERERESFALVYAH